MKKKGFSGDGGARGVDGWACRRQTHLLEEARVKIVSHMPPRAGAWISAPDQRLVRVSACSCFPTKLSSKGRSKGVALVGVLFGRNGGRRKISPVKFVSGKILQRWFGFVKTLA